MLASFANVTVLMESRMELKLPLLVGVAAALSCFGLAMVAGGALTKIFVRLDATLLSATRGRHGKSLARVALIDIDGFTTHKTLADDWRIAAALQDGSSLPLPLCFLKREEADAMAERLDELVAQLRTPAGYRQ